MLIVYFLSCPDEIIHPSILFKSELLLNELLRHERAIRSIDVHKPRKMEKLYRQIIFA